MLKKEHCTDSAMLLLLVAAQSVANPAPLTPQREPTPEVKYLWNVTLPQGVIKTFEVSVHPDWAPNGAARFEELVKGGFYTDIKFFRVVSGFMAQFGIAGDPAVAAQWRTNTIPDDQPVGQSNSKGTISFATSGPDSRTTQLFINLVDNSFLDDSGFTPFGEVLGGGMADVVEKIESSYGEGAPNGNGPDQSKIQTEGNAYLNRDFPLLSTLNSITVVA